MSIELDVAKTALELITKSPELLNDLDLPNINLPTMGGEVWWRNLVEVNGWRVQQNSVTKHCRILDPDNIRRGWGGEDAMMRLFKKIVK